MKGAPARVRVLVCGSLDREDDGAALAAVDPAVATLGAVTRGRVEVRRCGQLDPSDLIDVPDGMACLVLDTVVGVEPGAVVELSFDDLSRGGKLSPASSHALPVDQVLGLARTIRGDLPDGSFIGIGGAQFGLGRQRSGAVERGMAAFVASVVAAMTRLANGPVGGAVAGHTAPIA